MARTSCLLLQLICIQLWISVFIILSLFDWNPLFCGLNGNSVFYRVLATSRPHLHYMWCYWDTLLCTSDYPTAANQKHSRCLCLVGLGGVICPPSVSWAWLGSAAVCRLSSGYASDSFVVAVSVVSRVRILVAFSVGGGWLARRGAVLLVCAAWSGFSAEGCVASAAPSSAGFCSVWRLLKGYTGLAVVEFGWNVPLSGEVIGVTLVDPDSGCLLWWGSIKLAAAVAVETTKEIMFPL